MSAAYLRAERQLCAWKKVRKVGFFEVLAYMLGL